MSRKAKQQGWDFEINKIEHADFKYILIVRIGKEWQTTYTMTEKEFKKLVNQVKTATREKDA